MKHIRLLKGIGGFYWLRRFRFARKKMGGAWIKTAYRGWITYQTFIDYKGYGFDPKALMSEEEGVIKWSSYNAKPLKY